MFTCAKILIRYILDPRGNIHNIPLRCGPCGDPNSTHPGPVGHAPQLPVHTALNVYTCYV
jgi:hypothetical protein